MAEQFLILNHNDRAEILKLVALKTGRSATSRVFVFQFYHLRNQR